MLQGDVDIISSDDSEFEEEMIYGKKGHLGRLPRRKLENMLRCIGNTRQQVARVMSFALDRPDAAEEVTDVIVQSLVIPSTPVPRKVARLNALSDILHNCASSPTNAWKYRSLIENRLPEVFTHLGDIHRSFPGRMKAETFRKQIMSVVAVWEAWLVFTPTVTQDLAKRLENGSEGIERSGSQEQESRESPAASAATNKLSEIGESRTSNATAKAGFKPTGFAAIKTAPIGASGAEQAEDEEDLDGEAMDLGATSTAAEADDIDGEAIDGDDIDGAPL